MLLFTPELVPPGRDPLATLEGVLAEVDAVQIRVPHPDGPRFATPARPLLDWAQRVVELLAECPQRPLVLVNDRVDVAAALGPDVDGVHLGADDCPPALARQLLGPAPLIGLSTHGAAQVAAAGEEPVDYLGFGPIHPTRTKGYTGGLGPEAAWIAASASARPVFAIGGIDPTNAADLARLGRAAVGSAILAADDPAEAARAIRALLA